MRSRTRRAGLQPAGRPPPWWRRPVRSRPPPRGAGPTGQTRLDLGTVRVAPVGSALGVAGRRPGDREPGGLECRGHRRRRPRGPCRPWPTTTVPAGRDPAIVPPADDRLTQVVERHPCTVEVEGAVGSRAVHEYVVVERVRGVGPVDRRVEDLVGPSESAARRSAALPRKRRAANRHWKPETSRRSPQPSA